LKGFVKNVAECTMHNGYFIGTCYDGEMVFNELRKLSRGESIKIIENGKKIWEIIKGYDHQSFDEDSSSIGYRIDVFQESINQLISEYLVNFDYLSRVMRNYGFEIVNDDEAKSLGFSKGTGTFHELFMNMQKEISEDKFKAKNYGQAPFMTENEKKISFLNRYFIYKKVTVVNTESIQLDFSEYHDAAVLNAREEREKTEEEIEITIAKKPKTIKPKIRKLKSKIVLVAATEATDEEPYEKQDLNAAKTLVEALENPVLEADPSTILEIIVPKSKKEAAKKAAKEAIYAEPEASGVQKEIIIPNPMKLKKKTMKNPIILDEPTIVIPKPKKVRKPKIVIEE
jgi:hypothetical protein